MPVADMMGQISAGDKALPECGYITALEPCVGAGAIVLGFANALMKQGLDHRTQLVIAGVDIDLRCVHMAYIQLSIYGFPAVVIHGNTLTTEEWSRWYTPVYIADKWVWRHPCGITGKQSPEDEKLKLATEPMYAAIRRMEALTRSTETEKQDGQKASPALVPVEKEAGQMGLF